MADGSVRTTDFPYKSGLAATDSVVANYTAANGVSNTVLVSVQNLLGNSAINCVSIPVPSTPANSTANGVQGQITWDSGYIYVCVANGTWKRSALSSF